MVGEDAADYLAGLQPEQAEQLAEVNGPGLTELRGHLGSGDAVAFLGAGVSVPLYPLWNGLIGELVEAASERLTPTQATACRAVAQETPESAVEIVRRHLGTGAYREVLRQVLRVRTDPETGRSWTPVHELICRCAFKAVVTTNYDPGVVDARLRVRPHTVSTEYMTWEDELGLDRWRTGDVFGEAELPVLFAHGLHSRPDSVVLATTEYRRAYAGKLPSVLARLVDGHLVWVGFSFADQRIASILREIADRTGTRIEPGGAPRHLALMAWHPDGSGNDPGTLALRAEIEYGARLVLYPALSGDHSALGRLLAELTDERFPAAPADAAVVTVHAATGPEVPVRWVPTAEPVVNFTGRVEELARLDRWAADPQVSLIGVSAWGGAGKTLLVTHWVNDRDGAGRQAGVRGVFGWSFYADPSVDHWADGLLAWAQQHFGIAPAGTSRRAAAVLAVLQAIPLLLVLDGLEVIQEGPAREGFGRLLDGTLREVLAGACQLGHPGLVLLTSRFPFADLERFDGDRARMLEVPPFTPTEGSALLAAGGGSWLPDRERRALVRAVDGHALATGALAGLLVDHPHSSDLVALHTQLQASARIDARVKKVLEFYAAGLRESDRFLLAGVSLFTRPVSAEAVLTVTQHPVFGDRLTEWTPALVRSAVRERLAGLASWHPDGTISAHPLVRDTFRSLVMDAADTAAETFLSGLPVGNVTTRADGLRVVEAIELLLDADQWEAADDIYRNRADGGWLWLQLPDAPIGRRCASAFVGSEVRRSACASRVGTTRAAYYLNDVGLFALNAGDPVAAQPYFRMACDHHRDAAHREAIAVFLENLTECFIRLGQTGPARDAAAEAVVNADLTGDAPETRDAYAYLAWATSLSDDTMGTDKAFHKARTHALGERSFSDGLFSPFGYLFGEWLARTGRSGPAQVLLARFVEECRRLGQNADLARCIRILGRIALASGAFIGAYAYLTPATEIFRDGDFLTDLAETLPDLAVCDQAAGDLESAERHANEAIIIASPRGLIPAHSAALAVRAHIRAAQAAATGNRDRLFHGRDDAEAARRLALRHSLAWHELEALRAHAAIDEAEGTGHEWAAQAEALQARLIPPELERNPLIGLERFLRDDDG